MNVNNHFKETFYTKGMELINIFTRDSQILKLHKTKNHFSRSHCNQDITSDITLSILFFQFHIYLLSKN